MDDLEERIARVLYPEDWEPPTDKRGDDDPEGKEREKRWVMAGSRMFAKQVLAEIGKTHVVIERGRAERLRAFCKRLDSYYWVGKYSFVPGRWGNHKIPATDSLKPGDLNPFEEVTA